MRVCPSGTIFGNFLLPRKRKLADLATSANLPTQGRQLTPRLAPAEPPFAHKGASLLGQIRCRTAGSSVPQEHGRRRRDL